MGAEAGIAMHLVTTLSITLFKISVLIVGYLLAKMGYNLLIKGITGQFNFKGDFKGIKADLVSASPGTLFIVLAIILLIFATVVDKPFSTKITIGPTTIQQDITKKPPLPSEPPIKSTDK